MDPDRETSFETFQRREKLKSYYCLDDLIKENRESRVINRSQFVGPFGRRSNCKSEIRTILPGNKRHALIQKSKRHKTQLGGTEDRHTKGSNDRLSKRDIERTRRAFEHFEQLFQNLSERMMEEEKYIKMHPTSKRVIRGLKSVKVKSEHYEIVNGVKVPPQCSICAENLVKKAKKLK